jgi:hypothetical protein
MAAHQGGDALYRHKLSSQATTESTLHCIEVLGCVFSTVSALAHGEVMLAAWSLSALATSALALWLLHCRREVYLRSSLRDWLYAGMRLHRAYAIVGMRRGLMPPPAPTGVTGPGPAAGDRVYFAKAVLVSSSILPILLQSLVLQLQLPLQAAVQVAVAAIVLRAMPEYCSSLAADGVQQRQWAWLARAQGALSTLIMAGTSGSRGGQSFDDVPCAVLLSHLVVVFEVIVPILFVFFFDRAAALWFGAASPPGRQPAADSAAGDAAPGTGLASTWRASQSGVAAHSGNLRQRANPANSGAADAWILPSAMAVLLFGLGVSGVLFDVLLTYNSRHPL